MATQYAFGKIVTDGLVLALDAADRNSYVSGSTTWFDLSGNNNNGTLTNGPIYNSSNGGNLLFDGTNDYVDTNINMAGYTDYTLSMFAKSLDSWPSGSIIFRALCGNLSGGSYVRMNITDTAANILFWADGPGIFLQGEAFNITNDINSWYYYTLTKSTTFQRIYVNGILKNETTFTNSTPLTTYYRTLGQYGNNSYRWNGNISDYKIYNRALSTQEILQNYNAQKSRFNL